MTRPYLVMRVAERYGQDPFEMEQTRTEQEMDLLIWQEQLRIAEHRDELEMLVRVGGMAL